MVKSTLFDMQEMRIVNAIPLFDGFFRSVITQTIQELAKLTNIPPSVDAVFPTDLKEKFIDLSSRPMVEAIVYGAMTEIELFDRIQADKHREAKLTSATQVLQILGLQDLGDWFSFEVPQWLSDAALIQVSNSFDQPYWAGVVDTTRNDLTRVFDGAIKEGLSIRQLSSNIMSTMGADYSRMRATRVARTEMTDALNYGHTLGIRRLNQDVPELDIGKEWLSVFAKSSRSAHMALDGVTVPAEGSFTLNGVKCGHPGDQSLPSGDRCNCMCTVLSSFITEEMGITEDIDPKTGETGPRSLLDVSNSTGFEPANPAGKDTLSMFTKEDGSLTAQRQVLHDMIVKQVLKGTLKQEKQVFTFLGGGSASGKGSLTKLKLIKLRKGFAHIDADEIKAMLPEYQMMVKEGDFAAASYAHSESSILSDRIAREAVAKSADALLDGTGDNSIEKLKSRIAVARSGGHKVVGQYVTVDTEEAIRRSTLRAAETGREVPIPAIKKIHQSVTDIFIKAADENLFDELTLWDNNGKGPVKIFTMKNGKKQILDKQLWNNFLQKGSNPPPLLSKTLVDIQGGTAGQRAAINEAFESLQTKGKRLGKFIGENEGLVEVKKLNHDALGIYNGTNKIGLSPTLSTSVGELKFGDDVWAVGTDIGSTARHETGHRYWFQEMAVKERDEFIDLFEDDHVGGLFGPAESPITQYASTSSEELFAESFSAITHPKYKKGMLPPKLEKYMLNIIGDETIAPTPNIVLSKSSAEDFAAYFGKLTNEDGTKFDDMLDSWNKLIGMKPQEYFDHHFAGLNPKGEIFLAPDGLRVTTKFHNADGKRIGAIERVFAKNKKKVKHDFFMIKEEVQGKGIAKKVLQQSMEHYEALGYTEIELVANADVGGYAWSRYGFTAELEGKLGDQLNNVSHWMNEFSDQISAEAKAVVDAAMKSEDPRAIWAMADLTETVDGMPLGKRLLLGAKWNGKLDINDKIAMARFNAYIGKN